MCTFPDLVALLLPNPTDLEVTALELDPDHHQFTVAVTSVQAQVDCPDCHVSASRMHSHYTRTLADLPWADFTVHLQLTSRKWFCPTVTCPRRIFTERLPTVVAPWARRTLRLSDRQRVLGLTVGGTPGARVAVQFDQPTSRDTLLRCVRQILERDVPTPEQLGVDDFAFRKGRTYGTLLVDLDDGRPIDVLPDRSADTLTQWLKAHPGVELISRDRAGAYAEGASQGAPGAVQVADRWHLLKNLGDALSRVFADHPPALARAAAPSHADARPEQEGDAPDGNTRTGAVTESPASPPSAPPVPQTKAEQLQQQRQARRQTRYDQVHLLVQQGMSLRAIAEHLHLSRGTVRKYARASTTPTPQPRVKRASLLDPYKPYLLERWNAGCPVGAELLREIEACGYQGGRSIALDFIAAIRKQQGIAPMKRTDLPPQTASDPTLQPPTPRELGWLVLKRPDQLAEAEQECLMQVRQAHPMLELAITLAQDFVEMVRRRQPEALDNWLVRTAASGLSALQSFAGGIQRDYAAVKAALSSVYSNGVVEGNVNRLKYLKRQMYGRANFDLLRKRVLYAP